MSDDARHRLRTLGGIMASSPELLRAARLPINPVMRPQASALGDAGVRPLSADMFLPENYPLPSASQYPDVMPEFDDSYGVSVDDLLDMGAARGVDTTDEARAARGFGRSAAMSGLQEPRDMGDIISLPEVMVGSVPYRVDVETGSVFRNDGSPVFGAEAQTALRQVPEALYTAGQASEGAAKRRAQRDIAASQKRLDELRASQFGGVYRSTSDAEEAAALQQQIAEDTQRAYTEEDLMAQEVAPSMTPEQMAEEGRKALRALAPPKSEDPDEAERIARDAMTALLKTRPDTGTGDRTTGSPEPSKKDLRSRYKDNIALFKEIYGEQDEDRARDRAMSLAMIGLAIAAGQSPDALTNIAQGTLSGMQAMGQRSADRRQQERDLKTAALEAALSQQGAETEAEAAAEERRYDRETRLMVEAARNLGGATEAEKTRQEYLYNDVFRSTYNNALELENSQEEALAKATAAARAAAPDAPSAQGGGAAAVRTADPRVAERITADREQGFSDDDIRAALKRDGFDPALYGL